MTPLFTHGIIVYKIDDTPFIYVHTAFIICEI